MTPRFSRSLALLATLAALCLAIALVPPRCARSEAPGSSPSPGLAPSRPLIPPPTRPGPDYSPARPALQPVPPAPGLPRSPLADGLNAPAATARDDLRTVLNILTRYRESFGAFPAFADNPQLVNAIAGANPQRLGLLPRDHPAVNAATGELLDRWGTPYFFHALSRQQIELRSAGPDRRLHTEDDLVLASAPPSPEQGGTP